MADAGGADRWVKVLDASSGDIRRLTSVWRYSSIPIVCAESTAEHSFWVALYSALILQELGPDAVRNDLMAATVLYATVHDATECVTGDIIRLMKYATPEMKVAVDSAEELLAEKHLHPAVLSTLQLADGISKGTGFKPFVKAVVKVADFMSLFQFMRREALKGNLEIYPFFNRMVEDFEEMAASSLPVGYGQGLTFDQAEVYRTMAARSSRIRSVCFKTLEGECPGKTI